MSIFNIDPEAVRRLREFHLPQPLGFGSCMAPILFRADYDNGAWGAGGLLPYGPIPLDPAAKVLHYAQVIFEGLKAYRVAQAAPALFRAEMNARRFNTSARRMQMPELPEDTFLQALYALTAWCEPCIPRATGSSLYLRPFMFGTQPALGLGASSSYAFMVIASPGETLGHGPVRVRIERQGTRAAPGGTGEVKASGNYGASLQHTAAATAAGFSQPLWLDAESHRYIEECSVMNFFAVVDGELHTPALTGTILPGVTRASLIDLARADGLTVHERRIEVDWLLKMIREGRCTEAFSCGTAVVVFSISAIGDADGSTCELPGAPGPITLLLREGLLSIQEGRAADRLNWMRSIPPQFGPQLN